MSRSYTAKAIILKKVNFDEADKLITLLSKYKGKFTAIAKGVQKIASRRSPNLELFNKVKAHFTLGRNFDVLTEVETIKPFKKIKESLEKIGAGFLILEITNNFLADGQGRGQIFDLLEETLNQIEAAEDTFGVKKTLLVYQVKFLEKVGYRPELFTCVICKQKLSGDRLFVSPEFGGVLHKDCSSARFFTKKVSQSALKLFRFLQNEEQPQMRKVKIAPSILEETEEILSFYLEYLLEKKLKSSVFLRQVGKVSHLSL